MTLDIDVLGWDEMYPALQQVHGGPDHDNYLFSAFRQVEGQKKYSAWLFGYLMQDAFSNYLTWLTRGLSSRQRHEAIEELENKFDDYLRACVGDAVSEAAISEVRAAYEQAQEMSATWKLLF